MTDKDLHLACRNCGQRPGPGVLLILDEQGAICPYCRSLEIAGKRDSEESPQFARIFLQEEFIALRGFCKEIQQSTRALEVFLFSHDGNPLGYSSDRLPPFDLVEMGDLISSVISSWEGLFDLLGGDPGFILVGKEECHCLVRYVPPRLILAVIVEPEYPLEKLKIMLKPFIEKLGNFQKEASGPNPSFK
jgi:hypothetical protein